MAWPDFTDQQTRVRDLLNESSAGYYTDAEIKRWLNDGERDVAIKGLCIESINSKSTVANTRTIATPYNKVLYIEYIPGSGTPIGLIKISPIHVGHVAVNGITPQYWFTWGKKIGIEPIPTAVYTLNVYASILPTIEMSDTTDEPQIPTAFQLLPVRFAFIRGLLKSGKFQKAAQIYQSYISELQAGRDSIIGKYKDRINDTKVPDVTVSGNQEAGQAAGGQS